MVAIGRKGMDVRNLNDREQGQQGQTDHRGHREGSRSRAAVSIPLFLKSCQQHFLLKNTQIFDAGTQKSGYKTGTHERAF
jgi:hypothetical protein